MIAYDDRLDIITRFMYGHENINGVEWYQFVSNCFFISFLRYWTIAPP